MTHNHKSKWLKNVKAQRFSKFKWIHICMQIRFHSSCIQILMMRKSLCKICRNTFLYRARNMLCIHEQNTIKSLSKMQMFPFCGKKQKGLAAGTHCFSCDITGRLTIYHPVCYDSSSSRLMEGLWAKASCLHLGFSKDMTTVTDCCYWSWTTTRTTSSLKEWLPHCSAFTGL